MQHTVNQCNTLPQGIIFQLLGYDWMKGFKTEANCWSYKDPTGLHLLSVFLHYPQRQLGVTANGMLQQVDL